jgi:hypothetical protein
LSFKFFQENSCKSRIVLWIEFEKTNGAIYSGTQEYIAGVEKFQAQRHKAAKPGIAGKKKKKTLRSEPSSS